MKYAPALLLCLLVGCGPAPADKPKVDTVESVTPDKDGCIVTSSAKLVTDHTVGPITNLVTEKMDWGYKSECVVKFDITVNGETHHLEESETGLENAYNLCYYAKERARKNLLLELGGSFSSQAVVACRKEES